MIGSAGVVNRQRDVRITDGIQEGSLEIAFPVMAGLNWVTAGDADALQVRSTRSEDLQRRSREAPAPFDFFCL
jgi:hypothetical protein